MELANHSQQDTIFKIDITLDEDFKTQFQKLKKKYGEKMFAIEGLDKESLNITNFFDKFMNSNNVADASIDDNSNVTDKNITIMLSESRKPYNKLLSHNKIYIELKEKFNKEKLITIFQKLNISEKIRPEDLSINDWKNLIKSL